MEVPYLTQRFIIAKFFYFEFFDNPPIPVQEVVDYIKIHSYEEVKKTFDLSSNYEVSDKDMIQKN